MHSFTCIGSAVSCKFYMVVVVKLVPHNCDELVLELGILEVLSANFCS